MKRSGIAILLGLLAVVPVASAHELRPAYLELHEEAPGDFSVLWKTPMLGNLRLSLAPEFSGDAKPLTPVTTRTPPGAAMQTWTLRAPGLRGQTLCIRGLQSTMTDALVRMEFADGSTWVKRLTAAEPAALIPLRQSAWAVAGEYLQLGVEHIVGGKDHLLFVLGLLLLVRGLRRLVKTITAFTVSHSVTLTLAALGFVHVPQPPVEAVIALSIVFVATEIAKRRDGPPSLAERQPWLVAFTFGLLHGLGFAGGLSAAGLPAGHIPTALLFFSSGVELGHFAFVATALTAATVLRQLPFNPPPLVRRIPAYAIGCIAMFWLIQRVTGF